MKLVDQIKFVMVPMITVLAFTRFLITGEWSSAIISVAGLLWVVYDAHISHLEFIDAKNRAETSEKRELKDKTDLEQLKERMTKIELKMGFVNKRE